MIEFKIAFPKILKQSRPKKHLKPVNLNSYKIESKICPVDTLTTYINIKKELEIKKLKYFISFLHPHKPVGIKTISQWIKDELKKAGIHTYLSRKN